jgi:hypothetical protein
MQPWYRLGTLQNATLTKGQCPGWVGCLTGTQAQVGLRGLPFFCAECAVRAEHHVLQRSNHAVTTQSPRGNHVSQQAVLDISGGNLSNVDLINTTCAYSLRSRRK